MGIGAVVFALLILLVTLTLLVGGLLLLVMSRRGGLGFPACGQCHYDLTGSIGKVDRCPECGSLVAHSGIIPPKGRRSAGMIAGGIVSLVIGLGCLGFIGISLVLPAMAIRQRAVAQQQVIQQQQQAQQQQEAASVTDPDVEITEQPEQN